MDANNPAGHYLYNYASIEALLNGVKGFEDAALLARLKEQCGIDTLRPKSHYPLDIMNRVLQILIETRFANMSQPEAMVGLGRCMARGYAQTLVGRIMAAPLKVILPERAVQQMVKMFNTGQSFGQRTLITVATHHYIIEFRDDPGDPAFVEGVVRQFFEDIKLAEARIQTRRVAQKAFDMEISW